MSVKEQIIAELDRLSPEALENALYAVRAVTNAPAPEPKGLLERLLEIQIDAPEDFATNFDEYASGAKHRDTPVS